MLTLNIFLLLTNIFMAQINRPFIQDKPEIVMSTIKKGTGEVIKKKSTLDFPDKNSIFSLEFSVNYSITSSEDLSHMLQFLCGGKLFLRLTKHRLKNSKEPIEPECNYIPKVIKLPSVFKPHLGFEISLIHKYLEKNFDTLNEQCIYFSIHRDIKSDALNHLMIQSVVKDFEELLGVSSEEELLKLAFQFSIETDTDSAFETDILSIGTVKTEMFQFIFDERNHSLSITIVNSSTFHC